MKCNGADVVEPDFPEGCEFTTGSGRRIAVAGNGRQTGACSQKQALVLVPGAPVSQKSDLSGIIKYRIAKVYERQRTIGNAVSGTHDPRDRPVNRQEDAARANLAFKRAKGDDGSREPRLESNRSGVIDRRPGQRYKDSAIATWRRLADERYCSIRGGCALRNGCLRSTTQEENSGAAD